MSIQPLDNLRLSLIALRHNVRKNISSLVKSRELLAPGDMSLHHITTMLHVMRSVDLSSR